MCQYRLSHLALSLDISKTVGIITRSLLGIEIKRDGVWSD